MVYSNMTSPYLIPCLKKLVGLGDFLRVSHLTSSLEMVRKIHPVNEWFDVANFTHHGNPWTAYHVPTKTGVPWVSTFLTAPFST